MSIKCNHGNRQSNYWIKNPDKIKELVKWYPHLGSKILAKRFNTTENIIWHGAMRMGVKIAPHGERLCRCCLKDLATRSKNSCTKCRNEKLYANRKKYIKANPLIAKLKTIYFGLKHKRATNELNFDYNYLLDLYNKQDGKCFYTGLKMTTDKKRTNNPNHWLSISIDRVDNKRGYTKNNVVLCCWWANHSKCNLEKEQFYNFCKFVVNKIE